MGELLPMQIKNIADGTLVLPPPPLFYTLNPHTNPSLGWQEDEEKEESDEHEAISDWSCCFNYTYLLISFIISIILKNNLTVRDLNYSLVECTPLCEGGFAYIKKKVTRSLHLFSLSLPTKLFSQSFVLHTLFTLIFTQLHHSQT